MNECRSNLKSHPHSCREERPPILIGSGPLSKVHLPEGRNSTSSGCQSDLYFLSNSDLLNVAKIIQTLLKQPVNVSLSQRFVIKMNKAF